MTFRAKELGKDKNPAEQALEQLRIIKELIGRVWTAEPAVVTGYDFETQRVDVQLINGGVAQEDFVNIPILLTTGNLRIYRNYDTSKDPANKEGDIGILLFPRTESLNSFDDRKISGLKLSPKHAGLGPVFIPGPLALSENKPSIQDSTAKAADLDKLGPNDSAIVHSSGSHILFKENGEIVIKGTQVYFGDKEKNAVDFKKVAREGDDVGGTATQINEGSDFVFASD